MTRQNDSNSPEVTEYCNHSAISQEWRVVFSYRMPIASAPRKTVRPARQLIDNVRELRTGEGAVPVADIFSALGAGTVLAALLAGYVQVGRGFRCFGRILVLPAVQLHTYKYLFGVEEKIKGSGAFYIPQSCGKELFV
jgi:hypothetical protein